MRRAAVNTVPAAKRRPRAKPVAAVAATPIEAVQDPGARVLRRFRVVFNSVKAHFREVEKKAGLAGAQVWALSVIRDRPGIGVKELALAMDVHQSTTSPLVQSLVAHKLVEACKRAADRRTVQLHVLAAGSRVLRRAPGPFTGVLPQALARLDAETLARLEQDLGRLIDALDADEHGARIPLGGT
jgi:DNA-binding MarR family transcriptional regulator